MVSEYFWIYWAVAIPLTLATVATWLLWTRRQARAQRTRRSEAIEGLYMGLEGKGKG